MSLTETPEQRAERIFKEDEDKHKNDEQKELQERRLKRIAVVEKHKDALDAMIVGKQKAIRWRKYFHAFVFEFAYFEFKSEEQEYNHIGKPGRERWTDLDESQKAFGRIVPRGPILNPHPMHEVIGDIMREFGCFEY
jgi:hypothetical protein